MPWVWIAIAGALEIGWALGLVYSAGFTKLWPSIIVVACMAASLGAMSIALKDLPMGTAYAVWTGIGAAGTAIAGIILFGEPATAARLGSIALIIAGIAGLKIVG
jgi:quaternary ammonium compound-resistance protein SugE